MALVLAKVLPRISARKILLIFQRIGLGQHAAVGVSQQADLAEAQGLAHGLHVLHHVFDGVAGGILQRLRAARAALVNEDELMVPGQREQIRQEVVMGRAGPAMQEHQGLAAPKALVIDHDAVSVHVAFADGVHGIRGRRVLCGGNRREQQQHEEGGNNARTSGHGRPC